MLTSTYLQSGPVLRCGQSAQRTEVADFCGDLVVSMAVEISLPAIVTYANIIHHSSSQINRLDYSIFQYNLR